MILFPMYNNNTGLLLMRTKSRAAKVGYCGEDEHFQRKTNKIFPMV